MYIIETYDLTGTLHRVLDATNIKYSNHYLPEGSGFGYITFNVVRKPRNDYQDIGYGYKVILRKGISKILFFGYITKIDENSDGTFSISGVGATTIVSFDIQNFILADNRVNRWTGGCTPRGSYRPDRFDLTSSWEVEDPPDTFTDYDGIEIQPKRGVEYVVDDYVYSRYRFENDYVKRIKFTWSFQVPNNWPGKIELLDGDDNVLFTKTISGNGTEDINVASNTNFVQFKFSLTTSGENTAEENTVYFRAWNLIVYSTQDTVEAGKVVETISTYMASNYGYSSDITAIETIDYEIEQAAWDNDIRLDKIATEACGYGDSNNNTVIWGTLLDDSLRFFVTTKPNDRTDAYRIQAGSYNVSGDISDTYQKVYAKYRDIYGIDQKTPVVEDTSAISSLNYIYRKEVIDAGEVTSDQAVKATNIALTENKYPEVSTNFTVDAIYYQEQQIDIAEITAGRYVEVPDFQAKEVRALDTNRESVFSFFLSKVEVDLDTMTATLTPEDNVSNLDAYLETLRRISR